MNQNYKINISKNALKFINKQDTQQKKEYCLLFMDCLREM